MCVEVEGSKGYPKIKLLTLISTRPSPFKSPTAIRDEKNGGSYETYEPNVNKSHFETKLKLD